MESLWLLAKIDIAFQIAEKIAYGLIGIYSLAVGKRYYDDYKASVEEEHVRENL